MIDRRLLVAAGILVLLVLALLAGCAGPIGPAGPAGPQGLQGAPGPLPPGTEREVDVKLEVSKPANGTHFEVGQSPIVTVTLKDKFGQAFTKDDFATLNLYMYGPQEPPKTKTTVKMLNAETDRAKRPHHYIDLKTNADVKVDGNVLTYNLKPVSDEEAGTYIATIYAVSKANALQQSFQWVELQIGTATVEKQLVDGTKCQVCHKGADSGKFYFHHIDPRAVGQTGSWSIDSDPVRTCKSCHNTDGYAAYNGLPGAPATEDPNLTRVPDPIVRRVHGVHIGEGLKHEFDIDPNTGDFADYTHVVFPADVRNCTFCHLDDRYKTKPSRMACGACHDNVWFGTEAEIPAEMKEHEMELHPGGPQANDSACAACHPADTGGVKAVAVAHKIELPPTEMTIGITMTAPADGKAYVAGEKPTVTISMKDFATGAVIDPNTILQASTPQQPNEWNRVYLFVSGPREDTRPVLTTGAADAGPTASSYARNELRVLKDPTKADPKISRTSDSIVYQLDDVAGLKSGTYTVFVQAKKAASGVSTSVALINFQVGTATVEKQVATNCTACHGDTLMHGSYPFALAPDICKNCHDYKRQIEGRSGWTSAPGVTPSASNQGYGAAPISRRVHGVHFGNYLDKPEEVHGVADVEIYGNIIFPQDVRNCTKCHSAETSGTWKTEPSRLACLACHDKDAALTHAALNTTDATPAEPYSGDEVETCNVCHGAGREFSPDKVHNISNPYVPPYPREPSD